MALRDWLAPTADMAEATHRLQKLGAAFVAIALLLVPVSLAVPMWLQANLAPIVRQMGLFTAMVFAASGAAIILTGKVIGTGRQFQRKH